MFGDPLLYAARKYLEVDGELLGEALACRERCFFAFRAFAWGPIDYPAVYPVLFLPSKLLQLPTSPENRTRPDEYLVTLVGEIRASCDLRQFGNRKSEVAELAVRLLLYVIN
jgi:hypothetical protein